jgi:hypothetical protein
MTSSNSGSLSFQGDLAHRKMERDKALQVARQFPDDPEDIEVRQGLLEAVWGAEDALAIYEKAHGSAALRIGTGARLVRKAEAATRELNTFDDALLAALKDEELDALERDLIAEMPGAWGGPIHA